jgi:hypothetical protein
MPKFVLIFLAVWTVGSAFSAEIRLLPPHRTFISNNTLMIDAKAGDTLLEGDVGSYLNFGVVLSFTYFIDLYEKHLLIDQRIAQKTITKRVSYDLWTETYTLENDAPTFSRKTFTNMADIHSELEVLTDIAVISASKLKPDSEYYFKTRNTLKITQLGSLFHILFNALSVFKYKTTYLKSKTTLGQVWLGK